MHNNRYRMKNFDQRCLGTNRISTVLAVYGVRISQCSPILFWCRNVPITGFNQQKRWNLNALTTLMPLWILIGVHHSSTKSLFLIAVHWFIQNSRIRQHAFKQDFIYCRIYVQYIFFYFHYCWRNAVEDIVY